MNRVLVAGLAVVLGAAYAVLTVATALEGRWWGLAVLLAVAVLAVLLRGPVLHGPPVILGDDLARCVRDLLAAGRRTRAVRLVRQETGARLVPAARAVDGVRRPGRDGQDVARPS